MFRVSLIAVIDHLELFIIENVYDVPNMCSFYAMLDHFPQVSQSGD